MYSVSLYERFKKIIFKRKINFIFFGILVAAICAFALSFTPFTLKGTYFWQLLATISTYSMLYSWLKKTGKIEKYI
jgi:hypothetical protein